MKIHQAIDPDLKENGVDEGDNQRHHCALSLSHLTYSPYPYHLIQVKYLHLLFFELAWQNRPVFYPSKTLNRSRT